MDELYNILPTIMHQNDHYAVHPIEVTQDGVFILDHMGCAYTTGYAMVSRRTGQIELIRTCLPDAIFNAEHMNTILSTEPYKWADMLDNGAEPDLVN